MAAPAAASFDLRGHGGLWTKVLVSASPGFKD
jgi:hypothetical protein